MLTFSQFLNEKVDDSYHYHVTHSKHLKSIQKHGLKNTTGIGSYFERKEKDTHLWTHKGAALLRVKTKHIPHRKYEGEGISTTNNTIPTHHLEIKDKQGNWKNLHKHDLKDRHTPSVPTYNK